MIGKWHLGFELHGDGPRKMFDFSKPLTGGPLDCGFDYFYGLTKAPSAPPYFYFKGCEPEAKPTEQAPGTNKDLKTNGKHSRTTYSPGAVAPGFVHEQCNVRFCDDAVISHTDLFATLAELLGVEIGNPTRDGLLI